MKTTQKAKEKVLLKRLIVQHLSLFLPCVFFFVPLAIDCMYICLSDYI